MTREDIVNYYKSLSETEKEDSFVHMVYELELTETLVFSEKDEYNEENRIYWEHSGDNLGKDY